MRKVFFVLCSTLIASSVPAAAKDVTVMPVTSTSVTSSGQPILLPQHDARITVSIYDVAPGATLPEHKHPYPRYGYVLAGTLRIHNSETGKTNEFRTGDFIVEAVNQWHSAKNVGPGRVRLLVIDITEGVGGNTVLKQ